VFLGSSRAARFACDQQDQPHRPHQQQQRRFQIAATHVFERYHLDTYVLIDLIGCREIVSDARQIRLSLFHRHARLQ
jgi:hypothetical protein